MQDTLTGVVNRQALIKHLDERFANADVERALGGFALLMVSLDDFAEVARLDGRAAADELARTAAARLVAMLRDSDLVAYLDDGRFMVVIPQASDRATAARVAEKLHEAFAKPAAHTAHSKLGRMVARIGISLFPADAATREVLMQRALEDLPADK